MKRALMIAMIAVACAAAACGGGGGGAVPAAVGPPPPSPSPSPQPTPQPGNGTPLTGPTYGPAPAMAWGPRALADALQFPVQSGYDGAGQTIAIVMDAYPKMSDLQTYFTYFRIPVTGRTITDRAVGVGPGATGSVLEATLDVETVGALAPGANVIVYGLPQLTFQNFYDAVNQAITDNQASVVSFSAGGCEGGVGPNAVLQAASQKGIAVIASSGDSGDLCSTGPNMVGVSYPASDPTVIGVGGTETNRPLYLLTSTVVWNDNTCGSQCAGGGGVSASFAIPSYQMGVVGSPASTTQRNVPDVSMPAEYDAAYVSGSGGWIILDGTSWSAPQFAALMTETYEYCNARFTPPAAVPYAVYKANATPAPFIDVTSGNDQFGTSTPYYTAAAGFDTASGIGVPLGMPFANTRCPNRVPLSFMSLAPSMTATAARPAEPYVVDVRPLGVRVTDIGRRAAGAATRVQFVLDLTDRAAFEEFAVLGALRRAGFTVERTFANHLVIDANAPSATVERFFSTQMRDVFQYRYGTRYEPGRPVTVPASIAPYVSSVNLDDVVTMHSKLHHVSHH